MKKLIISILVVSSLAGCATTGNEKIATETKDSISHAIAEGKTSKDEVKIALGDPDDVSYTDSGNEIWKYKHSRATPKVQNFIPVVAVFSRGADVKTKELTILFDKNDIVQKYTMRESMGEVNEGLAH